MKKVSVYFKNYSSCLCHVKQMVLGNNFVTLQPQHSTQLLSNYNNMELNLTQNILLFHIMCHMLPNYYLSVKFVCPGWRIPHLTLISSVEMNTEMQLYPRGKVKCFKPAMQFFHLPKSFSVISLKLST